MQTFSKEKPIKCRKAILAYGVYHPAGSLAFCYPIIFYILPIHAMLDSTSKSWDNFDEIDESNSPEA